MITCNLCQSPNVASFSITDIELVNEDLEYDEYEYELIMDNAIPCDTGYICMTCMNIFTKE